MSVETNTITTTPPPSSQPIITATTPQQMYENALNFDNTVEPQTKTSTNKLKETLKNFLSNHNNSSKLYPAVALIVYTLSLVLIIFQKISGFIKLLLIILYIGFVIFTVMTFKNKPT